jgi:hypothetical protein
MDCPSCGTSVTYGNLFCGACGARLTAAADDGRRVLPTDEGQVASTIARGIVPARTAPHDRSTPPRSKPASAGSPGPAKGPLAIAKRKAFVAAAIAVLLIAGIAVVELMAKHRPGPYGHLTPLVGTLEAHGIRCANPTYSHNAHASGVAAVDDLLCRVPGYPRGTKDLPKNDLDLSWHVNPAAARRFVSFSPGVEAVEIYLLYKSQWSASSFNRSLIERVHSVLGGTLVNPPAQDVIAFRCVEAVSKVFDIEGRAWQAAGYTDAVASEALQDGILRLGPGTLAANVFSRWFLELVSSSPEPAGEVEPFTGCEQGASGSTSAPPGPPPSVAAAPQTPQEAAEALLAAWQSGDRAAALEVADSDVVNGMFAAMGSATGWQLQKCWDTDQFESYCSLVNPTSTDPLLREAQLTIHPLEGSEGGGYVVVSLATPGGD